MQENNVQEAKNLTQGNVLSTLLKFAVPVWLRDWSGAKRSEVNEMNEGMERLARNLGNGHTKQGKNSLADCF